MYNRFPIARYPSTLGFGYQTDITTSMKVTEIAKEEGTQPINITIAETDRPEVFADRVYGNSEMHWLLLHLNKKVNPYYDWILPPTAFDNFVEEKYPGYTLFLTNVSGDEPFAGSFRLNDIVFATDEPNAELQPSIQSSLKNARVVSYDPIYCRLVMDFIQKTAWVPAEGDYIAGQNTDALGVSTYYVARIGKVISSPYALHHFENSDGVRMNPLLPITLQNKYIAAGDLDGFTFGDTLLGKYINLDTGNYVVTNREYEVAENDNNRNIEVVTKPFADKIRKNIEEVLKNG